MFVVEELVPEAGFSGGGRILGRSRIVGILWGRPEGNGELGTRWRLVQWGIHGLEDGRISGAQRRLRVVTEVRGPGGLDTAEDVVWIDRHVRVDGVFDFSVFRCRVKT